MALVVCLTFQRPGLRTRLDLGTDGVGTKLMLAIKYDKHDTIGQDSGGHVSMIILLQVEPLFP